MGTRTEVENLGPCDCCGGSCKSCSELAALTLEAYKGDIIIPLVPGGMVDPEGFAGHGDLTIQSGNDGVYYVWLSCVMSGEWPITGTLVRKLVDGVMVQQGSSASQYCPLDPNTIPHNWPVWDSIDPFDTGPTPSDGWGVREV